jgi:mRNA interferase RelE/StbE
MIYKITFLEDAKKEWDGLTPQLRERFAKKLKERVKNPRVSKDKLTSMPDCYKIKFKQIGYRLVYRVYDDRLVVQVVAIGKRDKSAVYKKAHKRL